MLPRTFLTQLTPPRIAEALRRIEAQIWQPLPGHCTVVQTESFREHRTFEQIADAAFSPVPADRFLWGPKFAQRWFRVTLPAAAAGDTVYLLWPDQAEATVYLDGVPYSGIDIAHRYCPLPAGTKELHIESVCIRTGIWLDGTAPALDEAGSAYQPPQLFTRNNLAWSAFHDLRVLLDVIECEMKDHQPGSTKALTDPVRFTPAFSRTTPLVRRWCHQLEAAIDVLDRDGLAAFSEELKRIYDDSPGNGDPVRAILTGHAHIDLVWLWPERVGEFKTIHTWATVTRLLAEYPELRFGFSQTIAYRAIARRTPRLHERVQQFIARGQWEAVGASHVECDTHLPCGEALLRALQIGQEEFTRLRGRPSSVFWLPDVFGYNACMPQLLRGVGVTGFFTTKLSWSSITKFPHTSFRWRGLDGSEVTAHVSLLHDYNESVSVKNLREDVLGHQQIAVHPEVLVPTGYGDGGGGPTEAMCERARRVADLAGVPRTSWGNIEAFFGRLCSMQEELPAVAGELAVEIHRGVFTTHGRLKAAFRALERALQIREAAHVARGLGPIPFEPWERLLLAQFHDYIPGSSIWEVYAEAIPELERLARESLDAATAALTSSAGDAGWFNPLPIARTWQFDGKRLAIGPLQSAPVSAATPAPAVTADRLTLRSDRVEVEFSERGELRRLLIDGQPLRLEGTGHALWSYPDHPAVSAAWDVDRGTLANGQPAEIVGAPKIERGDGSAAITFACRIAPTNTAQIRCELRAGEPVLRIRYTLDWNSPDTLLKAVVTTGYRGKDARFACPFGSILRSQIPGDSRDEAAWEVPASRWMVVTDDAQTEGLAVITEAKYGFTVRDGAVGVSLVRSAYITEADLHPAIRELPDRPRHSDLETHVIELAVGRYAPELPAEQHPAALADTLFTPCIPCRGPAPAIGLESISSSPTVHAAWAKPRAPDEWVLRLQESSGRQGRAQLRLATGWTAVAATLAEVPIEHAAPQSGELDVELRPYQIASVLIRRSQ